jgi:SOS-response transcriptional repressor LexA
MEDSFFGRLTHIIEETGSNLTALAKASGLHDNSLFAYKKRPGTFPKLDTAGKIIRGAQSLGSKRTLNWLLYGVEGQSLSASEKEIRVLPILGKVAAGAWLDVAHDDDMHEGSNIPFDARYPEASQFGLVVSGASINRTAQDGDTLVCVSSNTLSPQANDLVIVERIMGEGALRETTAKRYKPKNGTAELWPDSTDVRFQKPIALEGDVRIIAVVTGVFRALR